MLCWPPIISVGDALNLSICNKNLVFVDATWYLDKTRKAIDQYMELRIENAKFFDIDGITDHNSCLPHMLPNPTEFSEMISVLGISNQSDIIIYENNSTIFSAPRAWFTFRSFGHTRVSVMDGGLAEWISNGGKVDMGPPSVSLPSTIPFISFYHSNLLVNKEDILTFIDLNTSSIRGIIIPFIDARSAARFNGLVDEPRPHLARGHIPTALNIPFTEVLDSTNPKKFKSKQELQEIFISTLSHKVQGNIDTCHLVFSCGSGVTAAVVLMARCICNEDYLNYCSIYDGSWSEWGAIDALPKILE